MGPKNLHGISKQAYRKETHWRVYKYIAIYQAWTLFLKILGDCETIWQIHLLCLYGLCRFSVAILFETRCWAAVHPFTHSLLLLSCLWSEGVAHGTPLTCNICYSMFYLREELLYYHKSWLHSYVGAYACFWLHVSYCQIECGLEVLTSFY